MRAKTLGIVILTACVLAAGHTAAMPGAQAPAAEPTPRPAQYLAAVMNQAAPAGAPTPTPPISTTVGLSGTVYVNPRWQVLQNERQPVEYLILLDVTGSMSWDFNGYGTYDGTNTGPGYSVPNSVKGDVQCDSPTNPNPLNLPYTDRCLGGTNSAWHSSTERRVYVTKQAVGHLIDQMSASDTMRTIAFSAALSGSVSVSNDWISDKPTLKASLLSLGTYQNDPYKTIGSASNAIAMQKARELLATAPTVAPNGQAYRQVVIMITDSVANVFLDGTINTARDICANLSVQEALRTADPCQIGTTSDGRLRPISAMIEIANSMKSDHPELSLYVVGLAQVASTGLAMVASAPDFFYLAAEASQVDAILSQIHAQVGGAICTAAGGYQWINTVDTAHLPDPAVSPGLSDSVVGYTYIYHPNAESPLYSIPITRDSATNKISFLLPPPDAAHPAAGIGPGTYEMMAYVAYKGDDQVTRLYDWFSYFPASAPRLTFTLTPDAAPGQIVIIDPLMLDLAPTAPVCP